tara:strand:- start:398 stop:1879 length:1482 start_codon:yes stop_codon:yes gene_type:complete
MSVFAAAIAARKLKRPTPATTEEPPASTEEPPASTEEPPASAEEPPPQKKQRTGFEPGESCLGNFKALGDWDEAVVVGANADGTYTLEYTDEGLLEENVPPSCVRTAAGDAAAEDEAAPPAEVFHLNESCMANFRGLGDWDEAVVVGVNPDGTYTVEYTDEGLVEQNVPADRMMRSGGGDAMSLAMQQGWQEDAQDDNDVTKVATTAALGAGEDDAEEEEEEEDDDDESDEEDGDPNAAFFPRKRWEGPREGCVFKLGDTGLGYYRDVDAVRAYEEEQRALMHISAPTLANWLFELLQEPPSLKKADRFMRLFHLERLRVKALGGGGGGGGVGGAGTPPLFESLLHWFGAYRTLLAQRLSHTQLQVTQRVVLEPQQSVRLGMHHVTFSIDWVQVAGCSVEPLSLALLRKMGMAERRPKRMLMVVMFKAERNQIIDMWVELDKEGLGNKKDLCLDDVLLSDAFDRCLTTVRKSGAIGELDPQFHNYWHLPVIGM